MDINTAAFFKIARKFIAAFITDEAMVDNITAFLQQFRELLQALEHLRKLRVDDQESRDMLSKSPVTSEILHEFDAMVSASDIK